MPISPHACLYHTPVQVWSEGPRRGRGDAPAHDGSLKSPILIKKNPLPPTLVPILLA